MILNHRSAALGLAGVRIVNGIVLVVVPRVAELLYLGPRAAEPTARALARFTGARELVLGVAAATAVTFNENEVEAVAAGALCDAVDVLVSVLSPDLAWRTRIASTTAAASAGMGLWASRGLARDRRARGVSSKSVAHD